MRLLSRLLTVTLVLAVTALIVAAVGRSPRPALAAAGDGPSASTAAADLLDGATGARVTVR